MSTDYNETYWRNRGGEGPSPWTGHKQPDVYPGDYKTNAVDELMEYAQKLTEDPESALDSQVGGGHYKDMAIQPVEYNTLNNLGFIEGCIVKYISRHEEKGGAQDLDKIIHFAQLLKELKYDQ